jgi:hypothetical protein
MLCDLLDIIRLRLALHQTHPASASYFIEKTCRDKEMLYGHQ